MGNSLQEQLLKAGLVSEQKLKETRADKRKTGKGGGRRDARADDPTRRAAEAARAEKTRKDRELNRQRQEEAERRARENELRQLIHTNRVVRDGGDVAFHFQDGGALKRLYVSRDHQARLVDGRLAVVRQDTFYELVPPEVALKVRERNAELVLVFNRAEAGASGKGEADDGENGAKQDDPYAAYRVPDDLMW